MNVDKILDELYSYSMFGIRLGLHNIEELCSALGNPQDRYRVIHIAGTNGKGSSATAIEAGLIEAGYRVGKFTSPHIIRFNERIQLNGEEISDEDVCRYYLKVKEIVEKKRIKVTFFEITTAMMFLYFEEKNVEFLVLETGLGGKYDATNIVNSEIALITNVTLDHVEFLGDNIYSISQEKAGIIKKDSKVIVGDDQKEFLKAIKEQTDSFVNVIDKYKNVKYSLDTEKFVTIITIGEKEYEFSLFGDYQFKNFLYAYEVLKTLNISDEIIQKAASKVKWPGRFEIFSRDPLVILDGAHNLDAARNLQKNMRNLYNPDDVVVITSILEDKDVNGILGEIHQLADTVIVTSLEMFKRGLTGKKLKEYAEPFSFENLYVEDDIKKAYDLALSFGKKAIVICGSFYTISRFKQEA